MPQAIPPALTEPQDTAIHRRVNCLRAGKDPTFIARLESGWAVLGEQQFLKGYCLLLPDPVVGTLNDLQGAVRMQVLADAALLGDVLLEVTGALRINYAVFGNQEPALHVHVVPRYAHEDPSLRTAHPWSYDWNAAPRFDPGRDATLLASLRTALQSKVRRVTSNDY